jgi:hypothetical protein
MRNKKTQPTAKAGLKVGRPRKPNQAKKVADKKKQDLLPYRHVVDALNRLNSERTNDENAEKWRFIQIENLDNTFGVAPTVCFTVQSDPVSQVGVNGVQALDMLHYVKCLFQSLNDKFPCKENELTIARIEEAIMFQNARTVDRMKRKVEGKNEL